MHSFSLQQYLHVGKPQHPYAFALKIARAQLIPDQPLRGQVLCSISFDCDPLFWTVKIQHVRSHVMLATELGSKLAASEQSPEEQFCICRLPTQLAAALDVPSTAIVRT